jgi:hypothetical protein
VRFREGRTHASRPCFWFIILGILDSTSRSTGRSNGVEGSDEDEEVGDGDGESDDEDMESSLSEDLLALVPSRRSTKYPNRSP